MITIEKAKPITPEEFIVLISDPIEEKWWCGIHHTGEFRYGGTYFPDEAAKAFWDQVILHFKANKDALSIK